MIKKESGNSSGRDRNWGTKSMFRKLEVLVEAKLLGGKEERRKVESCLSIQQKINFIYS